MSRTGTVFGGSLLVAGTAIGGGMLALPVLTSAGGFAPSLLVLFLCWLFMAGTGLLFLEVSLWMGGEFNIVSMAERTLGWAGKLFAWLLYLFLFYCLTVAYVSGGGGLVGDLFGDRISNSTGAVIFVLLFGACVFAGARAVDRINRVLVAGLLISFFVFLFLGYRHVDANNLTPRNWGRAFLALPIVFTSFGYQGMIPTLVSYLNFDARKIRIVILVGSFIPFIAYVVWQWLILGIVPYAGEHGLADALKNNYTAVHPLRFFIDSPSVYILGQSFAFFALVTSFLGVTLGLLDFLADGLKVKKDVKGRLLLCSLIYLPPLAIALINPHLFIDALGYAGGFGVAILLGLLPVLMVWSGRYRLKINAPHQLGGGKTLLVIMVLFVLFELGCEISHLLG